MQSGNVSNPDVSAVRSLYEGQSTSQSTVPFTFDLSVNRLTLYDCYCASHVISHYPVLEVNTVFFTLLANGNLVIQTRDQFHVILKTRFGF